MFKIVNALLLLTIVTSGLVADDFVLQDGERVVLLGNTLVEREQEYGDWELQLTLAAGERHIEFRNLGWSGDTVWAESRGMFDPPAKGYQRMMELIAELKPTTVILGYGTVESFQGPAGLEAFSTQYQKLAHELRALNARLIHVSPVLMETETFPTQSEAASRHIENANRHLNLYADRVQQLAAEHNELFVDFRPAQSATASGQNWTENGLHLSAEGYQATGKILVQQLGGQPFDGPASELRAAIQRKNELFFHRWRPQNFTYLLGFRQHEQGQNAVEIAQFDPLVAAQEKRITELKRQILQRDR